MIYAQVDVELRDHERIAGADLSDLPKQWQPVMRLAMLGLFTWCLLYKQAKKSADGSIAKPTVYGACGGGQDPVAVRLAACGLLEDDGSVFWVRNYVAKNRTREEIDASTLSNRERQQRYRDSKKVAPPAPSGVSVTANVTRYSPVRSSSSSSSVTLFTEPEIQSGTDTASDPLVPDPPPCHAKSPADEVHEHFLAVRKRHNPKARDRIELSQKDRRELLATLRRGLTSADLKLACDGLFLSPFHLGENDRRTPYLEFRHVLKNAEAFIALAENNPTRPGYFEGLPVIRRPDHDELIAKSRAALPDVTGMFGDYIADARAG